MQYLLIFFLGLIKAKLSCGQLVSHGQLIAHGQRACTGNANEILEEFLRFARDIYPDKISLPAMDQGEINLYNGSVSGLHSFRRGGNICLHTFSGGVLEFSATLELSKIHVEYEIKMPTKVVGISTTFYGHVNVDIDYVRIKIILDADVFKRVLELSEWEVQRVDGFEIKPTIDGFIGIFNSMIKKWVINQEEIKEQAFKGIKDAIVKVFKDFKNWDVFPSKKVTFRSILDHAILVEK